MLAFRLRPVSFGDKVLIMSVTHDPFVLQEPRVGG